MSIGAMKSDIDGCKYQLEMYKRLFNKYNENVASTYESSLIYQKDNEVEKKILSNSQNIVKMQTSIEAGLKNFNYENTHVSNESKDVIKNTVELCSKITEFITQLENKSRQSYNELIKEYDDNKNDCNNWIKSLDTTINSFNNASVDYNNKKREAENYKNSEIGNYAVVGLEKDIKALEKRMENCCSSAIDYVKKIEKNLTAMQELLEKFDLKKA